MAGDYGRNPSKSYLKKDKDGKQYIDYKSVENQIMTEKSYYTLELSFIKKLNIFSIINNED